MDDSTSLTVLSTILNAGVCVWDTRTSKQQSFDRNDQFSDDWSLHPRSTWSHTHTHRLGFAQCQGVYDISPVGYMHMCLALRCLWFRCMWMKDCTLTEGCVCLSGRWAWERVCLSMSTCCICSTAPYLYFQEHSVPWLKHTYGTTWAISGHSTGKWKAVDLTQRENRDWNISWFGSFRQTRFAHALV